MANDTITKASPADAGCWIDGHWGQYGSTRLIEIARGFGWQLTDEEIAALVAYTGGAETFTQSDGTEADTADWILNQGGLADAAEEWMNENVAPDGYSFGWNDGEFFLGSSEWWEEGP